MEYLSNNKFMSEDDISPETRKVVADLEAAGAFTSMRMTEEELIYDIGIFKLPNKNGQS